MMEPLISLTIDGLKADVPRGTLLVDAAKQVGIEIPVFCYHPRLKPAGMCRMCLVEIGRPQIDRATGKPVVDEDGQPVIRFGPNLETACTTRVDDGWVVRVNSKKAIDGRKQVVEFILTSHPLDCPICDKGGECPLQNQTMEHGNPESRFVYEDKNLSEKHVPLGDLIFLDRERCIQCGRCVRFQEEIAGDPVLAFSQRGRQLEIITSSIPGFDSYFSGNTTDICPVGALTTADFRFGARPWEMDQAASLCTHCPVGCNIMVNTRREAKAGGAEVIKRIMPRQNEFVNDIWICDKGRFGYHFSESKNRLLHPLARVNGELVEVSWEEAFNRILDGLKTYAQKPIGLSGGHAANEDYFLFRKLLEGIGGTALLYDTMAGGDLVQQYGMSPGSNLANLKQGDTILIVAEDLHEAAPIWWLRVKQAVERGAALISLHPRSVRQEAFANHVIRYAYGESAATIKGLLSEKPESLPAEAEAAAAMLRTSQNVVIFCGGEGLDFPGSQELTTACAALLQKFGHPGKPNNGIIPVWSAGNTQGAWDMGLRPDGGTLKRTLEEASLLYLVACDPVGDEPGLKTCLEDETFVIVHELFLTETAKLADVVLPAQSIFERDGTMTTAERRVQRFYPVIQPRGTAHPDWKVFSAALDKLDILEKMETTIDVFDRIAAETPPYAGLTYADVQETTEQWPPVGGKDLYFGGTAFKNKQGSGVGLPVVPLQETPAMEQWAGREKRPGSGLLAVPVTHLYDKGSLLSESEVLQAHLAVKEFLVHSKEARRQGFSAGDHTEIQWGTQSATGVVRIDETIPEGIILVPYGSGPLRAPVLVTMTAVREELP